MFYFECSKKPAVAKKPISTAKNVKLILIFSLKSIRNYGILASIIELYTGVSRMNHNFSKKNTCSKNRTFALDGPLRKYNYLFFTKR